MAGHYVFVQVAAAQVLPALRLVVKDGALPVAVEWEAKLAGVLLQAALPAAARGVSALVNLFAIHEHVDGPLGRLFVPGFARQFLGQFWFPGVAA